MNTAYLRLGVFFPFLFVPCFSLVRTRLPPSCVFFSITISVGGSALVLSVRRSLSVSRARTKSSFPYAPSFAPPSSPRGYTDAVLCEKHVDLSASTAPGNKEERRVPIVSAKCANREHCFTSE